MQLPGTGFIWFNGQFVPWADAKVHVATHALHYGTAVFEGLRAYGTSRGPAIVGLNEHVERLFQSCTICELPITYTPKTVLDAITELVRRNEHDACYIRPLVYRGYGMLGVDPTHCPVEMAIATWPHGAHFGDESRAKGVKLGVSSWRRMAPDTHPARAKAAANYLNSALVIGEARRHGYDDGLALDVDGFVSEGSGNNIFLVMRGALHTPSAASSILAGITRGYVMRLARDRGLEVREERLPREMLYTAEEVFVTGTAAEVTPVTSIDGRRIGSGARGPITASLQSDYLDIVGGKAADRHGWLTFVRS
ncbi:MAG: branched-chain amino acid transaminase [Planctomycetes bacterium]|nr:branched-chain amino acid transaminase [Planctomycetota bacterium]